jgi:hypothetical protein
LQPRAIVTARDGAKCGLCTAEGRGYPSIMKSCPTPCHSAHRSLMCFCRNQLTRIVMLVLGILSLPSVGARAMQGPHCAKHEHSALHPAQHQAVSTHPASVQSGTPHDCPHCPARECAQVVPCTTSTNPVTAAASLVVTESSPGHVGLPIVRAHLHSRTHEPPTPPPQLIA